MPYTLARMLGLKDVDIYTFFIDLGVAADRFISLLDPVVASGQLASLLGPGVTADHLSNGLSLTFS